MNTRSYLRPVVLLLELGILIYLLLPQSLFHSFSCKLDAKNRQQNYQASNSSFVNNQVIVSGLQTELTIVIGTPEQPGTAGVKLNAIESCDLSYLYTRKLLSPEERRSRQPQPRFLMQLYELTNDEIENGSTVDTVISAINQANDNTAPRHSVSVEPNYLTSLSDSTPDACIRNGDSGGSGGHPYGGPGPILPNGYDLDKAKRLFKEQWAFRGPHSIGLDSWINSTSSNRPTGDDIRIGVFDTSPFRNPIPFFKRIGIAFPSPLWYTTWDAGGATVMSNHGLFVTAEIHSIAPKSNIQLIRVLNDSGCGEVWVLNKGLHDYISRMSAWSGDLDDTVINMSLGIRVSDALPKHDATILRNTLTLADSLGAIIVAAAGNASPIKDANGNIIEDHAPMEIPASYPNVYGVAATNTDGDISCYSNKGDIAAPGGDGGKLEVPQPDGTTKVLTCEPRTSDWNTGLERCRPNDIANCKYGLISIVQTRYGPQYVIWSGTSFAAPLVSGMAALAFEENEKERVICLLQGGPPPIHPDPELGTGIIDIGNLTNINNTTKLPLCP
jgi:hypothetical protein